MTIPTQEIQALRDRAQEALDPLPYQRARLLPMLRCDRPVRFAVVKVEARLMAELVNNVGGMANADVELPPILTSQTMPKETVATWPAAQIVELCDAVLERRAQPLARECAEYESPPDDLVERSPMVKRILARLPPSLPPWRPAATRDAARIREQSTPASLKAALLDLPFVDSVQVEENSTLGTVDGMPPKSVRVIIGPKVMRYSALEEIARVFHRLLPPGIETCGDVGLLGVGMDYRWNWTESNRPAIRFSGTGDLGPYLDAINDGILDEYDQSKPRSIHDIGHCGCGGDGIIKIGRADEMYTATCIRCKASWIRPAGKSWRRINAGGNTVDDTPCPMAKVGAIDGVKAGGIDVGTEPDGRIHYTDEPPRALKEAMDEAVHREEARRAKQGLAQIDSTIKGERYAGYVTDDLVSKPDPRERLRREMAKGWW